MRETIFSCFIAFYFIVKYLLQIKGKPAANPIQEKKATIKYFVNDKEVSQNHLDHSRNILKFYNYTVSDADIRGAFFGVLSNVAEARKKGAVKIDMIELKSAREYLHDRWCYLVSKN